MSCAKRFQQKPNDSATFSKQFAAGFILDCLVRGALTQSAWMLQMAVQKRLGSAAAGRMSVRFATPVHGTGRVCVCTKPCWTKGRSKSHQSF